MDIKEKSLALAEELGIDNDKICYVVGMTAPSFEAACSGHKESLIKAESFFNAREYAFSVYNEEQIRIIREFERLIASEGSQSKAASKVGINATIISTLRRAAYKGKVNDIFDKLGEYFKIKEAKLQLPDVFTPVEYAPTTISQMIYERLRNVHVLGGCAVITGDAGIGKTKTIQKYAKDNPTKTVVITAGVYNKSPNDVLYLLAEGLGINDSNNRRIKNEVFSRLHDGMMIIVDEAQELTYPAVNALRAIPDYFESRGESVGLAFLGNPCFYNKFNGRYMDDRVQVSSRFVTELTYTASQIQFEDTKMLYPQLEQQNMMREIMFLHCIAITPNLGQRKALFIFKNAYNLGKYDLDALIQEAKKSEVHFNNLNELISKVKESL